MDETLLTQNLPALEKCEARIRDAVRRGMNATRDIGRQLLKIEQEKLYLARDCTSFADYVRKFTRWDTTTAKRIQAQSIVCDQLEDAGMDVPDNEAILLELARLAPEHQARIWQEIIQYCEEIQLPVNYEAVKRAVDVEEKQQLTQLAKSAEQEEERRGLELNLEDGQDAPRPGTPAPYRMILSEKGEEALERINRLCGEGVGKAIIKGTVMMSEDALVKWSEQEDYLVKNLHYYVFNNRWTVNKALQFERNLVDEGTTLEQLAHLARARGGTYIIQHQEFRIHIERVAASAA